MNEIYTDLTRFWAEIQLIHYQEYTSAAMDELQTAYAALYELIAGLTDHRSEDDTKKASQWLAFHHLCSLAIGGRT